MPKKVLVTGGGGFIGSHLVEALVQKGASVRVLDNFSTSNKSNLEKVSSKIELMEGDVRDWDACLEALENTLTTSAWSKSGAPKLMTLARQSSNISAASS